MSLGHTQKDATVPRVTVVWWPRSTRPTRGLGETFVLFRTDHYLQPFVNDCTFQLAVSK